MRCYESIGKKFNRLLILEQLNSKIIGGNKRTIVLCKCDCGNKKELIFFQVVKSLIKSCGCLHKEQARERIIEVNKRPKILLEPEEAGARLVRSSYKSAAKKRKLEFKLNLDIFKKLVKSNCYYCGFEPNSRFKTNRGYKFIYNGIDRVDNNKGYTVDNCVTCCTSCNSIKRSVTKNIIFKAYNFLFYGKIVTDGGEN